MLYDSKKLRLKHFCLTLLVLMLLGHLWSATYTLELWYPYQTSVEWGVYCGNGVALWWDEAATKTQPHLSFQPSRRYPHSWRFAFHFERSNGIVYVPMWSILAAIAFSTAWLWVIDRKTPELICSNCGYPLGGLGECRRKFPVQFVRGGLCSSSGAVHCPECGEKTPRVWRGSSQQKP
jgi:4-amino-4-deoxy-L-arabinose transferase-like glycosyltransferase